MVFALKSGHLLFPTVCVMANYHECFQKMPTVTPSLLLKPRKLIIKWSSTLKNTLPSFIFLPFTTTNAPSKHNVSAHLECNEIGHDYEPLLLVLYHWWGQYEDILLPFVLTICNTGNELRTHVQSPWTGRRRRWGREAPAAPSGTAWAPRPHCWCQRHRSCPPGGPPYVQKTRGSYWCCPVTQTRGRCPGGVALRREANNNITG